MRLSVNWLKDYIDPRLSTEALVERLTMAGLEVEAVEASGADTVLEIEITPNRPDCLNILGLAREIGAITGKTVKSPKIKKFNSPTLKNIVHVENNKDCARYIATVIRDVKISEAPNTMKERLIALGINAINNAVDITNFVLMETGQPLHAFDLDKLSGGKVFVRRAKPGESIITLDGVERKLDPSILIIADSQKPVAIAGIMGGKATEITSQTKNILLESAHFEMGIIRRACRTLGLRSDSSYRFERNVNFEGVLTGADRATDLLVQLTGGKVVGRCEIVSKAKSIVTKVTLKISDIEDLLGMKVTTAQVKGWLSKLGFKVTAKSANLTVIAPGTRGDISQPVDVIEEIARMIGFDRLPSKMPTIKAANITVDQRPRQVKEKIREVLKARGVDEIITHSLINAKAMDQCQLGEIKGVKIYNPLNQDQEMMRPALLPCLLGVARTNFNRGQKDLRFYELGKSYSKSDEKEVLGIILTGRRWHDWRTSKKETVDVFDMKGIVQSIMDNLSINVSYEAFSMKVFDPHCGAAVIMDGEVIGVMGKLNKEVTHNWDLKNQDVYYCRLHLQEIFKKPSTTLKYNPISEFPAIVRDVSLAVNKEIPYQQIQDICLSKGEGILRSVKFIEQYLGDKIQANQKGLVFSCHYQSNSRTLREEEVARVHEGIIQALMQDCGAVRR